MLRGVACCVVCWVLRVVACFVACRVRVVLPVVFGVVLRCVVLRVWVILAHCPRMRLASAGAQKEIAQQRKKFKNKMTVMKAVQYCTYFVYLLNIKW